jgi:uncharacterized metal-binding protein YceD (DUF177 family)
MSFRSNPRMISLSEIPEQGCQYHYSRSTGELNEQLKDLIGSNDYQLDIELKPQGNLFEVRGSVETHLDLLCSRCAVDFKFKVNQSFHEWLMVEDSRPRRSHSSHSNHASESLNGVYCNHLSSEKFDVGEYVHEIIASAEPIQPLGRENCEAGCENYDKALKAGWLTPSEPPDTHRPFQVLEQLKDPSKPE